MNRDLFLPSIDEVDQICGGDIDSYSGSLDDLPKSGNVCASACSESIINVRAIVEEIDSSSESNLSVHEIRRRGVALSDSCVSAGESLNWYREIAIALSVLGESTEGLTASFKLCILPVSANCASGGRLRWVTPIKIKARCRSRNRKLLWERERIYALTSDNVSSCTVILRKDSVLDPTTSANTSTEEITARFPLVAELADSCESTESNFYTPVESALELPDISISEMPGILSREPVLDPSASSASSSEAMRFITGKTVSLSSSSSSSEKIARLGNKGWNWTRIASSKTGSSESF